MRQLRLLFTWVLPNRLFYSDRFTVSARRLFARVVVGLAGVAGGLAAAGIMNRANWRDILGGALLAWGVSIIVWAVSSYRRAIDETRFELRHTAEVDLLHARLNQIAAKVGAPLLVVDFELEHALGARTERLAHFSGLDEFRESGHVTTDGYRFWTQEALGYERGHDDGTEHNEPAD